ncbi:aromatic-L-amino-acid decarboxylase [Amycolatopsis marina]|uniref:Aromatic-L-amino-acid decarboxylase n=1 Tax=Amycolatopsis marina TaxID=490629 RepID=A0A1I0YKP0_9PSEU|nr:aminotransferase class V-fold PLP-dependent enzyme [Amycolatopsis marina]SFB12878.1 aromatic-L-amino-acid decarboxylase [Amycolatopsis marina]
MEIGRSALELITDLVGELPFSRASSFHLGSDVYEQVSARPDEDGRGLDEALALFRTAAGEGLETAGPRYFGYVPSGGTFTSAVAELLTRALNRCTGLAGFSPALVAMEDGVIRWLCGEFGLPAGAGGLITTGGSTAHLAALVAARYERLGECFTAGTLYTTAQTHYSVAKAARIAGFPASAVRTVPTGHDLRMDPQALSAMIARDRAAGARPFLVVANAGTTSTGTVDPLPEIAALAHGEGLWFHVDGAYGGFFQLTARGRQILRGIECADSLVVDPHKSLFAPYGTGMLLVRDPTVLRAAHQGTGEYLQDLHPTTFPHYADYGCELTRECRGLKLWLPLWLHGVSAFRRALDEKLDLACSAYRGLASGGYFDCPLPPDLSTVVFTLAGASEKANRQLLEEVNATGRVYLSSTMVQGRHVLRLCVLSHRTHAEHVSEALAVLHEFARRSVGRIRLADTA